MFVSDHDDTEPVFLNVFQVILLDIIATAGIFVTLKTAGNSWLVSVLTAWMGGCLATLAIIGATYWILTQQSRLRGDRAVRRETQTLPALVPSNIDDPLQLWEADRLMERDHFQHGIAPEHSNGAGSLSDDARSVSTGVDAEGPDQTVPARGTDSDRRRSNADFKGVERRAGGQ